MRFHYKIIGKQPVEIVVEMGLGACLGEWLPIAKKLNAKGSVLLYERAGINQSEVSAQERTPWNIAGELYELLEMVQHTEQIILIAHSQGGLYAQQFCRRYPQMVSGIILLDPLSAKDSEFKALLSKKEYKKSGVDKSGTFQLMKTLAKLRRGVWFKKLAKNAPPFYYYDQYTQEETDEILGSADLVSHAVTALEEYKKAHEEECVRELITKEGFPEIPLILITHSSELAVAESVKLWKNTREFAMKIEQIWQDLMKEYLEFTPKSVWISAEKSMHYIHLMEPELLLLAIEKVREQIREAEESILISQPSEADVK